MKLPSPWLLLLLAWLGGSLCADPAAHDWTLAFEDDFNRDVIGMEWAILRGDWHIHDGKLRIVRDWTSDSAIRTARRCSENVRLEFDVLVPVPHWVKAAVRIGDQYWDGGGHARLGEVILVPPGTQEPRGDFAELQPNRTYRVAIEYEDGRLRAWVDGNQVKEEQTILGGAFNDSVALFAIKDADFDNVKVFVKPYGKGFPGEPHATPETNRRATVDAAKFLDPAKPDHGLQAAIDSLPPTGGAVLLPKGEFVLRQSLFLREGVALRGQGPETKLALPSPLIWTTLAAPAAKGATTLPVADASQFKPGWMLCLGVDAMYYLATKEPWRVKSVSGHTLELSRPLEAGLAEKTPIGNWFPAIYAANAARIEVRDLDILGRGDDPAPFKGGYGAAAVTFFFVRDARVSGVTAHGWKGDAFSFQGGRDNLLTDCQAVRAREKGFHPGSCQQRMIISRCLADRCGDDGFFFCRYNQLSAMGNNTYLRNRGAMIGGLASAGDMFNTINRNFGMGNRLGVPFARGANDVFLDNVIVNTETAPVLELLGGDYAGGSKLNHPYTGPSRYHVIAGNTFANEKTIETIVARPGAEANVIAGNQTVAADKWQKPTPPSAPPSLPPVVVDAAKFYDPSLPDCGFQKAILAAAAQGGTVRLPAGIFPLTRSLVLPSRVTLCGEGIATRLVWKGDSGAFAVATKLGNEVGVRRLAIEGGGIVAHSTEGLVIEGVDVEAGKGPGIESVDSSNMVISQSRVRGCRIGYNLIRPTTASIVESFALENEQDGLFVASAKTGVTVDSSIFWFNRRNGIRVEGTGPNGLIVMSSVVSSSGEDGIFLQDGVGALVRGNVVHNSSLLGKGRFAGVVLRGNTHKTRIGENRIGDELFDPLQRVAVRELDAASANEVRRNVLCPNHWPRDGTLDVLSVAGNGSIAAENVLTPFPRPSN